MMIDPNADIFASSTISLSGCSSIFKSLNYSINIHYAAIAAKATNFQLNASATTLPFLGKYRIEKL